MPNSFIEQIVTVANATKLAATDIVEDTEQARNEAVAARDIAIGNATTSALNEEMSKNWANKGHNNPVAGSIGVDAEFSSYHWATEASLTIGDPLVNDSVTSSLRTWSSDKIASQLATKAEVGHNHAGIYEPAFTKGSAFNKSFVISGGENGTGVEVARSDHNHSLSYEPLRTTSGNAYNKDFGVTSGTVSEGDHSHAYEPSFGKETAFNKAFVVDSANPLADEVSRGNHIHTAAGISYDNTGDLIVSSTTVEGAIGQLDSVAAAITISEKCKMVASMTNASYTVGIVTAGVHVPINAAMTLGANTKNALYNNGIQVDYAIAPAKLVEGQYGVTTTIEVLANTVYEIALTVNGTLVIGSTVEVGSADKAIVGAFPVTLSVFASALNNGDIIGVAVANLTDTTDVIVYDMITSFAGQPEGSLIVSGAIIDHSDLTGTGAAGGVHTISDIQNLQVAIDGKANLVAIPVLDNLLSMDANGDLKDSGVSPASISNGMNFVATPVLDNIVSMTSTGDSKDSGLKVTDFALSGGSNTQAFLVGASVDNNDAVPKSELLAVGVTADSKILKVVTPTAGNFPQVDANGELVDSSYDETSFATAVHTHSIADTTGLQNDLDDKYAKVAVPVTDNVVSFGAGGILLDSGVLATDVVEAPLGVLPVLDGSNLTGLSSGFSNPMTTIGDIIIRDGANVTSRLGIGLNGEALVSDGTNISWGTVSTVGVIDDLTDVDTTTVTPVLDNSLVWNGTNWSPKALSSSGNTGDFDGGSANEIYSSADIDLDSGASA